MKAQSCSQITLPLIKLISFLPPAHLSHRMACVHKENCEKYLKGHYIIIWQKRREKHSQAAPSSVNVIKGFKKQLKRAVDFTSQWHWGDFEQIFLEITQRLELLSGRDWRQTGPVGFPGWCVPASFPGKDFCKWHIIKFWQAMLFLAGRNIYEFDTRVVSKWANSISLTMKRVRREFDPNSSHWHLTSGHSGRPLVCVPGLVVPFWHCVVLCLHCVHTWMSV